MEENSIDKVNSKLAEARLGDVSHRLRFQHEYAVEGFKTLTLINGGAIIALLTYAGHYPDAHVAAKLGQALAAYSIGLVASVLDYLVAYLSQAQLMNSDQAEAYRLVGTKTANGKTADDFTRAGHFLVYAAIVLTILSVGCFVAGSVGAMSALA